MDYYFLVLWTELCYHIWLNHAINISSNTVLLHTRVSIYNNISIIYSHFTCLYMYIASCYINCLLFLIRLVNAATHLMKFKIYSRNIYNNILHKYTIILTTKYITQTMQTKLIATNKYVLAVLHYCHIHVHNENTLIILILLCSNFVLVHMTIQKQCMNIIISFNLCSFLVYPIMFICILISLSNDHLVSCIIICVWVRYPPIIIHHPHVHVFLYHFTCRYHTVRYNMDICISFCLTLFIKKYLIHIALHMFMFYSIRNIDRLRVGLARGGKGGVPPQAPCLIKFIRIDIDLYIR